jgi:hypothetical protein
MSPEVSPYQAFDKSFENLQATASSRQISSAVNQFHLTWQDLVVMLGNPVNASQQSAYFKRIGPKFFMMQATFTVRQKGARWVDDGQQS